jgi:hypothetical protein
MRRPFGFLLLTLTACLTAEPARAESPDDLAFFESKIRPVLENHCLKCHNSEKRKGGLTLDHKDASLRGGDSGPAVVPGNPADSLLISALRYENFEMPPDGRLPDDVIADFTRWIEHGAVDPRSAPPVATKPAGEEWEQIFQERLRWWSLQPVKKPQVPTVRNEFWPRNEVDRFILARLEAQNLAPAPPADRRSLARRLSFALTGLPPRPAEVESFANDAASQAYEQYVDKLLASPHFGERWARHWMDVVHYSDTHGYEWEIPVKHGYRYRDYLIRAFNADLPYRQLVLEHLAGDLLDPPRIGPDGLNESIIGPTALRLGERRHGDNQEFDGITQQAIDNVIDTTSKTFLATTVGCSQCHNHKLDAVSQHDYYALAGTLMSSRWVVRSADTTDPNQAIWPALHAAKANVRTELAKLWLKASGDLVARMRAAPSPTPTATKDSFPSTPQLLWQEFAAAAVKEEPVDAVWQRLAASFAQQRTERIAANQKNWRLLADFTADALPAGWQVEGLGIRSGLVRDGDFSVTENGPTVIRQLLPAGRWTHAWSLRLGGAVRAPMFDKAVVPTVAIGYAGGMQAAHELIIDHALFPSSTTFFEQPNCAWLVRPTHAAAHLAYLQFTSKSYNNHFPMFNMPLADDLRSWFGLTRVYAAVEGSTPTPPQDELDRFRALLTNEPPPKTLDEAAVRIDTWLRAPIERWCNGATTEEDVKLLNTLVEGHLLPTETAASPELTKAVEAYRLLEVQLHGDRTVGSIADLQEAHNERVRIRGELGQFGDEVPRGNIRLLQPDGNQALDHRSGRLELAQSWVNPANPLTARVMVNRVWHYLFGAGLVRTTDDFGHLGEQPSDPELLDWLATRFVEDGWSIKRLVRMLVLTATWQQSGAAQAGAAAVDPENRLWHCRPPRRLEAEAIRDAMLAVAGRLDTTMFGPPLDPFRTKESPDRHLFSGPIDGAGRRSVYIKMTMMEPPKFLALFNEPIPKLTVGKRDVTNVPDQALALLNDPFVQAMAKHWSEQVLNDGASSSESRAAGMFATALGRPADDTEINQLAVFAKRSAELRGVSGADRLRNPAIWQDVAHVLFNLKEFIYVP